MAALKLPRLSNRTKLNLFLDIILTLIFIAEMERDFTGMRNHELIGLAFGVLMLVHIVLHWSWIVSITKTFFRKVMSEARLNYVLGIALFIDMAAIVVTGLMISETLGLDLGVGQQDRHSWEQIHILAADLSLIIVALHVAMHWKWIVTHGRKYLFSFRLPMRKKATATIAASVQPHAQ